MKASYKEMDMRVGYQEVHLMPGDFIFGLNKASSELRISVQSIRTIITALISTQNITVKPTNKFSIISINNWDTYQADDKDINTQINTQLTNNQQTTNTQLTTNKNEKNVKNKTYTDEFLKFYAVYPKKVGKDFAWKAWLSKNGTRPPTDVIISAIERLKVTEQWIKNNGQYIPNPATWLNRGGWDDDYSLFNGDPFKGAL